MILSPFGNPSLDFFHPQCILLQLPLDEIIAQNLPLPHRDLQPETLEEQVICYADKFYSKTHLDREKTIEQAARSLAKFGDAGVKRFLKWAERFE